MVQKERCRAKNPQVCWKHGSGVGFEVNREIKNKLNNNSPIHVQVGVYSLKRMESPELAEHIVHASQNMLNVSTHKVRKAVLLASDLHKTDTQTIRPHHKETPYIEHPLRNTLRLIRLGCSDESIIIGLLLHDTVEDHPFEMAKKAGVNTTDEHEARATCYRYIEQQYGRRAALMVEGMSNLTKEGDGKISWQEKNTAYANHVFEAIQNPDVFLGKVSYFIDKASSLHHTESVMSPVSLHRKASKYLLVNEALRDRLLSGIKKNDISLPESSLTKIYVQLSKEDEILNRIKTQHDSAK